MSSRARIIFTAIGAGLFLLAASLLYLRAQYHSFLDRPLNVGADPYVLLVEYGDSLHSVVQRLERDGLTRFDWNWRWLSRTNPVSLHVGEYSITGAMRPADLLELLGSGKVVQHRVTILEGWTWSQLLQAITGHEILIPTLDQDIAASEVSRLAASFGPIEYESLEGLFLPETYYFVRGESDVDILRRAYRAMQKTVEDSWEGRALGTPFSSPYEMLILASIIEKETSLPEERDRIAGVFVRRLQKGMRLQTDPTVIYGMGAAFDGNIRKRDLMTDTPYNTYTRHGLPPTPIALPGKGSILAAAHPAGGTALYFVANGQGGHTFSDTLQDHEAAVKKLLNPN